MPMLRYRAFARRLGGYRSTLSRYVAARFKRRPIVAGLPPGLAHDVLASVMGERFGESLVRCAHRHLSGWKDGGTYRILATTAGGAERTLIFKDEVYTAEHIPALEGLPVLPGPPEAQVYAGAGSSPLSFCLPTLFWQEEVRPDRHFRYLLDDLSPRYRGLRKDPDDLLLAVRVLARLQRAMAATVWPANDRLLRYDRTFAAALAVYARTNLDAFVRRVGGDEGRVLEPLWPTVERLCADAADHALVPIHGDYNRSNIHVERDGGGGVRVVDWEWAGYGPPQADLAALLKGVRPAVAREAARAFAAERGEPDASRTMRLLRPCRLQRRLLDAGFLAAQHAASQRVPWMEAEVRKAVAEVVAIVQEPS